jgi:Fur family transcriptional regulator, stress-responsive regulator
VTAPRLAVLEVLGEFPHADTDTVLRAVRERLGSVSTQAVYDVLAAFVRVGLARRIEPAGLPTLFERNTGDGHHHVICRSCGTVADVRCAVGVEPCLQPLEAAGFLIDEAEITWWGLCARCREALGSTPGTGV